MRPKIHITEANSIIYTLSLPISCLNNRHHLT